jgi:single-strand DNA-binding protein
MTLRYTLDNQGITSSLIIHNSSLPQFPPHQYQIFASMINKVTLIGRLGGDPEIRHLEGGAAVARFSLATNESYKDKDGNWQDLTEWHNIVVWRDQAERAAATLKKGGMCYVEGKISYRKYTTAEGQEKTSTDIVASAFRTLEKREGSGADSRFPSAEPAGMSARSSSPSPEPANGGPMSTPEPNGGDDLPF